MNIKLKVIKTIKYIAFFTLIIPFQLEAQNFCESYIKDEWKNDRYSLQTNIGESVVIDQKTNLMWKQCGEGLMGIDCLTGSITNHTWQQALEVPVSQNIAGYAGYSDWRLPNIKELQTIYAMNCSGPATNISIFPNTPSEGRFWSSSPFVGFAPSSWSIFNSNGFISFQNRNNLFFVRLVRSGN